MEGSSQWKRHNRGTQSQAIGRSRGGISAKTLALSDALGNLVSFRLMPGQAYDLRENLDNAGIVPVITLESARKFPLELDKHSYKWRHMIENYFQKLTEFKRIALRACKTDQSFSLFTDLSGRRYHQLTINLNKP